MKVRLYYIIFFYSLISCGQETKEEVKNDLTESPTKKVIEYYRCDYASKDSLIVILSSGYDSIKTEIWAIDKSDIENFKVINFDNIDLNMIIENGENHLHQRFKPIDLTFSELSIQRINDKSEGKSNWVVVLSFKYDKRGYFQMVPLLLDGKVILSNHE